MFQKIKEKIKNAYNNNSFIVRRRKRIEEYNEYGRHLKKHERVAVEQFKSGNIIRVGV